MIESIPLDIKDNIRTLTLEARSKRIIRILHDYHKQHYNHFLAIYPDPDQPWKTPFVFWISNWIVFHYLYMWYLLNEYYLCIRFELGFYKLLFPNNNRYFENFWFEILKMMLIMEIGNNIPLKFIQDLDIGLLQDLWLSSLIQKKMFKQKEFSTCQKFIGSLIQIILSMCMWTPLGHVAIKHSGGQKLSTQEFKTRITQVQALQKSIISNCHMLMLRNYPILY